MTAATDALKMSCQRFGLTGLAEREAVSTILVPTASLCQLEAPQALRRVQ